MMRKDHHRALSAWARQLGPVYAIRIVFWHVRIACINVHDLCSMPPCFFAHLMPESGPHFTVHTRGAGSQLSLPDTQQPQEAAPGIRASR